MMKILALETTEKVPTMAVAEDHRLLASATGAAALRSAQSLVPGIRQLLGTIGWQPADIELVAVSAGPGSFTGLRVGVVAAKVLAYAAGSEVLGVDTLEVIAAAAPPEPRPLWAAVDAQRGQWVVRLFGRSDGGWPQPLEPAALVDRERWLGELPPGSMVTGPALRKLAGRMPDHLRPLPPELWPPAARQVAALAARHYAAGCRDDLWTLAPRYSRPSAAEEKLRRGKHVEG